MRNFLLACLLTWLSHGFQSAAEETQPDRYEPDHLDYYLYQAFNTPFPEQRYSLNHIGIDGAAMADGFLVSAVLQGYPAHQSGIVRGDVITSASGQPFHPVFSFNDRTLVPARLNPQNRSYELEIQRGEQKLSVSVYPVFENLFDSYRAATVNSLQEFSSGNKVIGYIQLWALSRNSADLLTLQQLIADLSHCDGIILDLRGSYGFLDREQLRLFNRDTNTQAITGGPDWLDNWQTPAHPISLEPYRKPLAVLIDARSRGAAELLALMLAAPERNTTLGASTAGLLGDMEITSEDALNYFPAAEMEVNNLGLEGRGVQPEQEVRFPFSESRRDDPQFETAVTLLLGVI